MYDSNVHKVTVAERSGKSLLQMLWIRFGICMHSLLTNLAFWKHHLTKLAFLMTSGADIVVSDAGRDFGTKFRKITALPKVACVFFLCLDQYSFFAGPWSDRLPAAILSNSLSKSWFWDLFCESKQWANEFLQDLQQERKKRRKVIWRTLSRTQNLPMWSALWIGSLAKFFCVDELSRMETLKLANPTIWRNTGTPYFLMLPQVHECCGSTRRSWSLSHEEVQEPGWPI